MISELCVFELASATLRVVLRHDSDAAGRIEAPNWLPGGEERFLVNGGGRLFVASAAGLSTPLDLAGHEACNNDHGPGPDGRTIAFSDKTETDDSCIYLVDWDGARTTARPRRVTPDVPSWFHGWSPDGGHLVYVGARGDDRVVRPYVWDLARRKERLLADGFDHVDGPDMTPAGDYCWFNGEKDGAVNLWRVPMADGRAVGRAEQMTDGATVDWFPHPSPCGNWTAFITYPEATAGHPFGVEVGLCLMPQGGGPVREVARIFGGQGCLNVPSWAPDGSAFAFMRYGV